MKHSVVAYRAANPLEAHLIKHALEARDIPVELAGEGLSGALGELPVDVLQIEIRTPPEYADEARAVIESYQDPSPTTDPPWQCPFCGADNEPDFDVCWRCERERPPF